MKQITVAEYIEGINSIYIEQPEYKTGQDGSNGQCDCIGMCRGALKRKGIQADGMGGTNYAARKTIKNLQKIKNVSQLRLGDVVLKTRDKDDKSMPLPDRYRKGAADYSAEWGETNFTHIGTVTSVNPLRITHMTSPTAKIDTDLGKWNHFGQLPWVNYETEAPAEDQQAGTWARVYSENGEPVKMREKPSTLCRTWWKVPCGAEVILMEPKDTWSEIIWAGRSGYMMTKYLKAGESEPLYSVLTKNLTKEQAEELVRTYGGEIIAG